MWGSRGRGEGTHDQERKVPTCQQPPPMREKMATMTSTIPRGLARKARQLSRSCRVVCRTRAAQNPSPPTPHTRNTCYVAWGRRFLQKISTLAVRHAVSQRPILSLPQRPFRRFSGGEVTFRALTTAHPCRSGTYTNRLQDPPPTVSALFSRLSSVARNFFSATASIVSQ